MRRASGLSNIGLLPTVRIHLRVVPAEPLLLTKPMFSASCALYWRQRNQISLGFLFVLHHACQVRRTESGIKAPTRGPVCPKMAFSDAMERSQTTCNTCPPPIAYPLTAAMTGLGMERFAFAYRSTLRREPRPTDVSASSFSHLIAPEQNALSPATGNDNHPNIGFFTGRCAKHHSFHRCCGCKGIAVTLMVDGDAGTCYNSQTESLRILLMVVHSLDVLIYLFLVGDSSLLIAGVFILVGKNFH